MLAASLIPVAAWTAYFVARYVDNNPAVIDHNGSSLGVLIMIGSVFAISKVAHPDEWSERTAISLGLSAAYFLLSWVMFGDPAQSIDQAPHVVWYGLCVAAFAPAVVLIPASQWAWSALASRRGFVGGSSHSA